MSIKIKNSSENKALKEQIGCRVEPHLKRILRNPVLVVNCDL
jgi:hypothetical protein